ncbi:MAG: LamG-like jellyroll fold domain-containing protein, partial [Limisphaerales bacterium]
MNAKNLNSRNLFAVTATLMLTVAMAHAQSAFTNALMNLSTAPVGYWPLQETTQPPAAYVETNLGGLGSDANAYYITTNAQMLSLSTLVPFQADNGAGVDFVGNSSSFMIVPTTDNRVSLPAGKPFSVELWVQPTTFNSYVCPVDQSGPFFGGGNPGLNGTTNGNAGWMLGQMFMPRIGQAGTANRLYGWSFHVFNGVGGTGAEADAAYPFTTNTWYHIVGVFDGVNCSVYVDGANVTTLQIPMTGSFVPDTWDPIQFGCNRGYGANSYHGGVAEVAIYTNALSALVISNDYQAGLQGSGYTDVIMANNPYMYWRMAAPAYTVPPTNTYPLAKNFGSDADPNITGLYQPGTLPGSAGPQFAGMGVATNAVAFNGMNSAVMIWTNDNSITSPLNVTNQSISVAFWFKGNPADVNVRTYQGIVSRGDNGWHMSLGPNGHLHWSANASSSDLVSTWPYDDGNWHFVVAEYQNTGSVGPGGFGWDATNLLYVDGYLDNSALNTNNESGSITNNALLIGGDPSFAVANLGINGSYTSSQRYLAGSVAQVAYFTNALTPAQVLNLYNSAQPTLPPSIVGQTQTGSAVAGGPGTSANFEAYARGTGPLTYQWYFNTTSNYNGATALANDNVNYFDEQTYAMTVSNLADSESGYYYVVANNPYGYATSALQSLTVYAAPVITGQTPSGAFSMFTNQTTALSVSVLAPTNTPLTFQWYTNDVADTTAGTSSNYFASAQSSANNETFKCVVANTYGSA